MDESGSGLTPRWVRLAFRPLVGVIILLLYALQKHELLH